MDATAAEVTVSLNRQACDRSVDAYVAGIASLDDQHIRTFCRDLLMERISGLRVLDIGAGLGADATRFESCATYERTPAMCARGASVFQVRANRVP